MPPQGFVRRERDGYGGRAITMELERRAAGVRSQSLLLALSPGREWQAPPLRLHLWLLTSEGTDLDLGS